METGRELQRVLAGPTHLPTGATPLVAVPETRATFADRFGGVRRLVV